MPKMTVAKKLKANRSKIVATNRFRLTPSPRKSAAWQLAGLLTHRIVRSPSSQTKNRSVTVGFVRDYSGGAVPLTKFRKSNFAAVFP